MYRLSQRLHNRGIVSKERGVRLLVGFFQQRNAKRLRRLHQLVLIILAAMSAKGTSEIENIEQIDRGYEAIDERLNALGAHITRK